MEKRIGLASDFVLYGYVLQGMTTLFDWWSVFSWISLGFGLIALGLSIKGAMLAKKEENSSKKLRRSIYYVCLSVLLVAICAFGALR